MFSQTVEYALRAVAFLAQKLPDAHTTAQIAEATKVPPAYLSKVIQGLCRADILRSQRGIGGGVSLARPPEELSILDVVNAVEPLQRINTCPLGLAQHGTKLCSLHRRMDNAFAQVEGAFAASTLADLLADSKNSIPLCDVKLECEDDSESSA